MSSWVCPVFYGRFDRSVLSLCGQIRKVLLSSPSDSLPVVCILKRSPLCISFIWLTVFQYCNSHSITTAWCMSFPFFWQLFDGSQVPSFLHFLLSLHADAITAKIATFEWCNITIASGKSALSKSGRNDTSCFINCNFEVLVIIVFIINF